MARPTIIRLREDSRNPAHVSVSVFVGRNPGSLGHAGQITVRVDEWEEIAARLAALVDFPLGTPTWLLELLPPLEKP